MLKYLLKSADFSALGGGLGSLLNPELIAAIPAGGVFELGSSLLQASLPGGKTEFERRMAELSGKARDFGLPLQIGPKDTLKYTLKTSPSRASGEAVLQLYFFQILNSTTWLLDFRSTALLEGASGTGSLHWSPAQVYHRLDPSWVESVRSMYTGYYLGQIELFDRSLEELGLTSARESLLEHFGTGDQSAVSFELARFQKTFLTIFKDLARQKRSIRTEFIVLGLSLLALYENLETLGGSYNVRESFLRALKR